MSDRIDLHTHSTCSDGTLSPEELVRAAAAADLAGLSITDHDTVEAYVKAKPVADELGLLLIPGVEFSAATPYEPVHILGYSYRLDAPSIAELCLRHARRRDERNRAIIHRLNQAGMEIDESELAEFREGTVGRPHIALLMMRKGYVRSVQDAFHRFIGEGKSCYAAGDKVTVEETIEAIHAADGLAVIAHPHLLQRGNTLAHLVRLPFDGIEGYYARMHKDRERKWIELGRAHNWIVTGGSDFHGECKPQIPIGASWVALEAIEPILARASQNG